MNKFVPIAAALCSAILAGCSSLRPDRTHPNAADSTNADILAFARQHPAGYRYQDRAIDCGDANMEEAIKVLTDIPHPWTVEKLTPIFIRERDAYINRLDYLRRKDIHYMWPKEEKEARHCGCLATVLAASRDPKAAAVLGHSLEVADCPDATKIWEGLFDYFLEDARYQIVLRHPPEGEGYTNFYPIMYERVMHWWKLNKEQILAEASVAP